MSFKKLAILATSVAGLSAMAPAVSAQDTNVCSQEYLTQIVYYNTGSSQLNGITSQIDGLQGIASSCDVRSIELVGHTDATGSAATNQRLSLKRANEMKAELVRRGVPADLITTIGRGEAELFIPTADGVAEDLNRRLEAKFTFNPVYVQSEPVYVEAEPVFVQPEPVYVEPVRTYVEPVRTIVAEAAPIVEAAPVVAAQPVVPVAVAKTGPNGLLILGTALAAATAIVVIASDDDDSEPASP